MRLRKSWLAGGEGLGQEAAQAVAGDGQLLSGAQEARSDEVGVVGLERLVLGHAADVADQADVDEAGEVVDAKMGEF